MRRLILAAILAAFLMPSVTQAQTPVEGSCHPVYSVKEYKAFANKTYKRNHVTRHEQYLLHAMLTCQHSKWAYKKVNALHVHYKRLRYERQCSQSSVLPCIARAARRFHVAYGWLYSCAKSESGLDPYKPNSQGSGAYGLFQFMKSTYDSALRRLRLYPKSFSSAKYQSIAAAFKFSRGESGEWTGTGC